LGISPTFNTATGVISPILRVEPEATFVGISPIFKEEIEGVFTLS
jgi:hypothetical protein